MKELKQDIPVMQSTLVINNAGDYLQRNGQPRLPGQRQNLFITDLGKSAKMQISIALAKSSLDFIKSAEESPGMGELRDVVLTKNAVAAGELDLLAEYEFALYCMQN